MKERKQPWYGILLGLTILFTFCALLTLVPMKASKLCKLGYYAHCSYTPISTIICLSLALVTCKIRAKYFLKKD